ncbi:Ig-like domain-containing protein [Coraliomargarita sp. SDUM461003]|uniref:Ig-like domain-containing protein n=1 Tax=Thalassobacterium maritimum TaxID=3041265 RepID=A0ABU1ARX7_9BACT|nr:Ig-like domain-containing protein [Coraliomargarita sp. SDUM461003]MDQ8205895.1 Ig-like domain-containing protein [Coraliomargarita sp. SDUM461003]
MKKKYFTSLFSVTLLCLVVCGDSYAGGSQFLSISQRSVEHDYINLKDHEFEGVITGGEQSVGPYQNAIYIEPDDAKKSGLVSTSSLKMNQMASMSVVDLAATYGHMTLTDWYAFNFGSPETQDALDYLLEVDLGNITSGISISSAEAHTLRQDLLGLLSLPNRVIINGNLSAQGLDFTGINLQYQDWRPYLSDLTAAQFFDAAESITNIRGQYAGIQGAFLPNVTFTGSEDFSQISLAYVCTVNFQGFTQSQAIASSQTKGGVVGTVFTPAQYSGWISSIVSNSATICYIAGWDGNGNWYGVLNQLWDLNARNVTYGSSVQKNPNQFIEGVYPGGANVWTYVPDWWKARIILFDSYDYLVDYPDLQPGDDFDGDAISNLDEFLGGTIPFSAADLDSDGVPYDWEFYWDSEVSVFPSPLVRTYDWGGEYTETLYVNNPGGASANFSAATTGSSSIGYSWEDSISGSIAYSWSDISVSGTQISSLSSIDDGIAAVTLTQFEFPYYGREYSELWVSSNGYLSFKALASDGTNQGLPSVASPSGIIAAYWDDLDTALGGDIYYKEEAQRLIVQYEAVAKDDGSGVNTFQIILNADGSIEYQYKQMNGDLDENTVGIQNVSQNQGLQLRYNSDPSNHVTLQNGYAIRFNVTKELFSLSPTSGSVSAGGTTAITATVSLDNLLPGVHYGSIDFSHDGLGASPWIVPVQVSVPFAKLTEPPSGFTLWEGEDLSEAGTFLRAKLVDAPDDVDYVEFRYADTVIDSDSSALNDEYSVDWEDVPAGAHWVYARMVLDDGGMDDSQAILIFAIPDADEDRLDDRWEQYFFGGLQEDPLGDYDSDGASNLHEYEANFDPTNSSSTPSNIPSVIEFTKPSSAISVLQGETVKFEVNFSDVDFGSDKIEFYVGGNLIGVDTSVTTSASFEWVASNVGAFAITAISIDRYGAETSETPAHLVTVLADSDSDGMSDDWELLFFGDLTRDGLGDFDSDGILDRYEWQFSTDPSVDETSLGAGSADVTTYTYDAVGRLLEMDGNYSLTYTFDDEGNLTSAN